MYDNINFENNDTSPFNIWKRYSFYYERDSIKYYVSGSEPILDDNFSKLNNCIPHASIRYLTPREIIEEYLNNPCSIFCGKVVPIRSNVISPPSLPSPPAPPLLSRFGSGIFQSDFSLRVDGAIFPFDTLIIEGNAIEHVNGTTNIILAPNTTYSFDWVNISMATVLPGNFEPIVGAVLLLDGVPVQGGEATVLAPDGVRVNANANGVFTTGNTEQVLTLRYIVQMGVSVETTSILSILVV